MGDDEFSNSQDGVFATLLQQMKEDEKPEREPKKPERKSERDRDSNPDQEEEEEEELDIYAEQKVVWQDYHNTWRGTEVTFNFRNPARHKATRATYIKAVSYTHLTLPTKA